MKKNLVLVAVMMLVGLVSTFACEVRFVETVFVNADGSPYYEMYVTPCTEDTPFDPNATEDDFFISKLSLDESVNLDYMFYENMFVCVELPKSFDAVTEMTVLDIDANWESADEVQYMLTAQIGNDLKMVFVEIKDDAGYKLSRDYIYSATNGKKAFVTFNYNEGDDLDVIEVNGQKFVCNFTFNAYDVE